jgi:hypothetical protein
MGAFEVFFSQDFMVIGFAAGSFFVFIGPVLAFDDLA